MGSLGSLARAGLGAGLVCALLLPSTAAVAAERVGDGPGIAVQESGSAASSAAAAAETSVAVSLPLLGDHALHVVGRSGVVRATVTAAATDEAPDPGPPVGTVEFFDGDIPLGSAAVVATTDRAGVATLDTDRWSQGGARAVSAVFTPAEGAAFAASASASAQTYRVVDTTRIVPDVELSGDEAAEIRDASLEWTIANIWFSNFGVGFEREAVSGDVSLPVMQPGTTTAEKQAYYFRPFTFAGGVGSADGTGNRRIAFEGTARLTSGSGNQWNFADPEVRIAPNGDGYITAEFSGFYSVGTTQQYGPVRVTIATFSGAQLERVESGEAGDGGTSTVEARIPLNWEGQANGPGTWAHDYDDSFPNEFVALLNPGVNLFFARSAVATDASKVPHPVTLRFTEVGTADPVDPVDPVDPQPAKDPFRDVSRSAKFSREINWMAERGLSTGIRKTDASGGVYFVYEPKTNVSREAMAAFLYRLYAPKGYVAPKASPFADVKPGDKFYREISWMYQSKTSTGIKQASGKPRFEPKAGITREAMAAFMYRLDTGRKPAAPKTSPFADVRPGQKFYAEIAWMSQSGLSTGISQGAGAKPVYAAKNRVTREAMAAFLYRAEH